MKRLTFWRDAGKRVYLRCALPLPPHLPIQSSFLELSEKETLKERWEGKSWSPRSYHPKFRIEGFWVESCTLYRALLMRKVAIQDRPSKVKFLQLSEKQALKGKWNEKSWNPGSYHPKFVIAGFWVENCKKNRTWEKVEIQDLPSKAHSRTLWRRNWERKTWFEKQESKIYPSKAHWHQSCARTAAQNYG